MDVKNTCFASCLPGELWLAVLKYFHPIYDDLFTVSRVCKKWRNLILSEPDPLLWGRVEIQNIRTCYLDSVYLKRFGYIVANLGNSVRVLRLHRCHEYFVDVLKLNPKSLRALQVLQITGMYWDKNILQDLQCPKTLQWICLEGYNGGESSVFNKDDLQSLVGNFPKLEHLSLKYSVVKTETLSALQDLVGAAYSSSITALQLERAKIAPFELDEIVSGLKGLKKFSYGNDQIYGLPSIQHLTLNSKSLTEVNLFQIGDYAECSLDVPSLQKLSIDVSTSIQTLDIEAPSLRVLHLLHCMELRKLRKISSSSIRELRVCRCTMLPFAELIGLLAQNPDIKTMEVEMQTSTLRLDEHSNPSLERLVILDGFDVLTSVNIRCPKLRSFTFKKSFLRSSLVKTVTVATEELDEFVLQGVPHLRKINLNIEKVHYVEIDFDRRMGQIKPAAFTKLYSSLDVGVKKLKLKNCNVGSIALKNCNMYHLVLDSCNLDQSLDELLASCNGVNTLTLQQCYGPCQLTLHDLHLKELFVESCSPIFMDHINITCPLLEQISIHGCMFLPSKKEIEETGNELKQLCPMLRSVRFSH